MNWEAMGAIGEIVGAVGVIATLGYLALQVRQNSNVTRSASRQAISNSQSEFATLVADSPDLRAAAASLLGIEILTPEREAEIRDSFYFRAMMRMFENQYHQHEAGTFDADMWLGYRETMRLAFSTPKAPPLWKKTRAVYSLDFVKFVERELIGSPDAVKPD